MQHIAHFLSLAQDVCGTAMQRVVLRAAYGLPDDGAASSISASTDISVQAVAEMPEEFKQETLASELASAPPISDIGSRKLSARESGTKGCISLVFGISYRNFEFALGRAEALSIQLKLRDAVTAHMPMCLLR